MPKINREEYEILKGLDGRWKWLARDNSANLFVYKERPKRFEGIQTWDDLKDNCAYLRNDLFQFIQWEDEEPCNIAELIEGYEYSTEHVSHIVNERVRALGNAWKESEETEVKKNIEWLREEFDDLFNGKSILTVGKSVVDEILDQLDEPEVLSDKWIDDNSVYASSDGITEEYVHVDDLKELLVPKQELPVIPKFVAEFLIGKEDYMLYELFDDEWLYEEHDRVAKWLYDNDELTNKQREIDLVMARDRGYTVEEEQKYYVLDKEGNLLIRGFSDGTVGRVGDRMKPDLYPDWNKKNLPLTEQEIKDYEPRYMAFAKPVEELEE